MSYPSIRIEGAIFSPDILDRLEDRGRCIDLTVSSAPSLDDTNWWMNHAPTERAAASFFDFTSSR